MSLRAEKAHNVELEGKLASASQEKQIAEISKLVQELSEQRVNLEDAGDMRDGVNK
jgi:exonuclease VII small subunit